MMIQRKLLFVLFLSVATIGWAQSEKERSGRWSVTPQIGANLWTARYNWGSNKPMDRRLGLTAGAEVGYEVVPRVSVSLGADYVLQRFAQDAYVGDGVRYAYIEEKSVTTASGRLYFPVMLDVNVWNGLSFSLGIQPGITLHSNNAEWTFSNRGAYLSTYFNCKYHFDRIHWYLPLGVSYEYRHWMAELRYLYSLKRNHWKTTLSSTPASIVDWEFNTDVHDSMLQLTLGYRFRL